MTKLGLHPLDFIPFSPNNKWRGFLVHLRALSPEGFGGFPAGFLGTGSQVFGLDLLGFCSLVLILF